MTSSAPGVAAAGGPSRCRACNAEVPAGASRCPSCNAPAGKIDPCPHCRGEGGISPDPELRFVCDLCGGPRIPRMDATLASSGREVPALLKADAARKARGVWRGAAAASAISLLLAGVPFALLLIVIGPSLLVLAPGVLFTSLFAIMLWVSVGRSRLRGREIAPAIDAAWLAAASDLGRTAQGKSSAAELAKKLGMDEAKAEELLALADVNEAMGEVAIADPAAARLRIAAEPGQPLPPDPAFEALEKAAAEQEAEEAALKETSAPRERKL